MILFAALFLGETITLFTLAIAIIVVFSVVIGKNASVSKKEVHPQKMVNKDA
jgi:drug/metabolite transporter (DMT)-like permease